MKVKVIKPKTKVVENTTVDAKEADTYISHFPVSSIDEIINLIVEHIDKSVGESVYNKMGYSMADYSIPELNYRLITLLSIMRANPKIFHKATSPVYYRGVRTPTCIFRLLELWECVDKNRFNITFADIDSFCKVILAFN